MKESTLSNRAETRAERFEAADRGQEILYHWEHWFAWLTAAGAIVLGVIAALVGFGIIGDGETAAVAGEAVQPATFSNDLANGLVWALPGLSAAILSYSMHRAEHHRRRAPLNKPESEQALWSFEHLMAMVAGTVGIALGVVAILVGFDVFDRGNIQGDGYLWGLLSIGASTLSLTFHTVEHHQMAETIVNEDYLTSIVDARVRGATTTTKAGVQERDAVRR